MEMYNRATECELKSQSMYLSVLLESADFCFVFLTIAALSFLGLGIQPPTADWGSMVRENANLIQFAAYDIKAALTPLLPATTIALLTIAVNFIVDWFLHHTSGIKDE